ncbi:MAG: radical SAM protein [Gemmataceae bacterium]|nr:radical SAM protein [Gemmataceae bacterium]
MTVELRPLGVSCNISCQYCYQNPQRAAGNLPHTYDLERMKAAIEDEGGPFVLFGGEPLLLPEPDLEELWSWGFQRYGKNSLQTNGALVNDNHVRMFKAYRVGVGISVDGPGELNDVRWAGDLARTRQATARTHAAIEQLCREGIPPNLIVTLHRNNATADKLPVMHEWLRHLERLGVRSVRLHILEVDHEEIRRKYALSPRENLAALLSFAELERELGRMELDLFGEMRDLLLGQDDSASCVWEACDPYTTQAVRGVEGSGQRSNCGRTNKDGIDFVKSDQRGFERYLALYQTPQDCGGCRDCRFFLMCRSQCPGTAIDGDWRNRSEHCEVWFGLFERLEAELTARGDAPLSLDPIRERVESLFVQSWTKGRSLKLTAALRQARDDLALAAHPAGGSAEAGE